MIKNTVLASAFLMAAYATAVETKSEANNPSLFKEHTQMAALDFEQPSDDVSTEDSQDRPPQCKTRDCKGKKRFSPTFGESLLAALDFEQPSDDASTEGGPQERPPQCKTRDCKGKKRFSQGPKELTLA